MPASRWSSTRWASARSACSKPSCRRGIATARTPSATTWSAARTGADDVLAPLLLARWAEAYDRVDGRGRGRHRAAVRIRRFARALRRRHAHACSAIRCTAGISMRADARSARSIGYSDANKESGICASRFAAYRAQAELSAALAAANERHVIFHARGGSIARGGCAHRFAGAHRAGGHRSTACCASPSRARSSTRVTACGPSRCARSSAPSMRSRHGLGGTATGMTATAGTGAVRGARRRGQPAALPAPRARRRAISTPGSRRSRRST